MTPTQQRNSIAITGRVTFAHGLLWRSDTWYRRAWYLGPQIAAVAAAGWLLTANGNVAPPAGGAAGWAKPMSIDELDAVDDARRKPAETDATAYKQLKAQADRGDSVAQFDVGLLLNPKVDIPRTQPTDMSQALPYYKKAAEQGHMVAATLYGYYLTFGYGVAQDTQEGLPWLLKGVDANVPVAQQLLGRAYTEGVGVPQNRMTGMQWFRKAAEQGLTYSAAQLGHDYWNGVAPANKDPTAAVYWLTIAVTDATDAASAGMLGQAYMHGIGAKVDIPEALKWFRQAAEHGQAFSQTEIGLAYWRGTPPYRADPFEAVKWLKMAAATPTESFAQHVLGLAYRDGHGVDRNLVQARYWFEEAAKNGDPEARQLLQQLP